MAVTDRIFKDMPPEIERLPRDGRGFPIPAFAGSLNGQRDFRVIDPEHFNACVRKGKCWICGGGMGARRFYVIGPMCGINRVSSEPASHRGCAIFAARNCPFLATPMAKRNERGLPDNAGALAGVMIPRNPGVTLIWEPHHDTDYLFDDGRGNPLFNVGEPKVVTFWAKGDPATPEAVWESVVSGFPALFSLAIKQGPVAIDELAECAGAFIKDVLMRFYPGFKPDPQDLFNPATGEMA